MTLPCPKVAGLRAEVACNEASLLIVDARGNGGTTRGTVGSPPNRASPRAACISSIAAVQRRQKTGNSDVPIGWPLLVHLILPNANPDELVGKSQELQAWIAYISSQFLKDSGKH